MPSTVQTKEYDRFRAMLKHEREQANISQRELSRRLGKPLSYIGKVEAGTRRIDVIETASYLKEVGADVEKFFSTFLASE